MGEFARYLVTAYPCFAIGWPARFTFFCTTPFTTLFIPSNVPSRLPTISFCTALHIWYQVLH